MGRIDLTVGMVEMRTVAGLRGKIGSTVECMGEVARRGRRVGEVRIEIVEGRHMFLLACIDFALVMPPVEVTNADSSTFDGCHLFVGQVQQPAEDEMDPFEMLKRLQKLP